MSETSLRSIFYRQILVIRKTQNDSALRRSPITLCVEFFRTDLIAFFYYYFSFRESVSVVWYLLGLSLPFYRPSASRSSNIQEHIPHFQHRNEGKKMTYHYSIRSPKLHTIKSSLKKKRVAIYKYERKIRDIKEIFVKLKDPIFAF